MVKPPNWISATGTNPAIESPIDAPTMLDSESGVSKTRRSPKRSSAPSVARNTVDVVERAGRVDLTGKRTLDDALEPFLDRRDRGLVALVVPQARAPQLGPVPLDRVARAPFRELVLGDVARRVVGVRVRAH